MDNKDPTYIGKSNMANLKGYELIFEYCYAKYSIYTYSYFYDFIQLSLKLQLISSQI